MNEAIGRMETGGAPDDSAFQDQPLYGHPARPAMAKSSAQHGECMGHSAKPPAGQEQPASTPPPIVEGVCQDGSGHSDNEGQPCEAQRLETLGDAAVQRGIALYRQEEPEMVTPPSGSVCTDNVCRLLEYQSHRCALTGRVLTPETASLDHLVPVRRGGQHVIENTIVLHRDVNRAKGTLTVEEFVSLCREVVLWQDRTKANQ